MSTYETHARTDASGRLLVHVPPGLASQKVRVLIESVESTVPTHAPPYTNGSTNGTTPGATSRPEPAARPSPEERRRFLDSALGSIDDPTFVRPPQGEYEVREPLD